MSDGSDPLPLTDPIPEAITIVLDPALDNQPWRLARRRLTTALRVALGQPATGWRVRRVPYTEGVVYDLLPPDELRLTAQEAWDLTYALRDLPDVLDAEPSFAMLQDAYLPPANPLQQPLIPPAAPAPAGEDPCADDDPPAHVSPKLVDWCARLVDALCAWQLTPPPNGKTRGAGVRIGHPDSGYRYHTDLFAEPDGQPTRVQTKLEYDFVDRNRAVENSDGQHGLSTGSFIMSSDQTGKIVGIAPAAEIVPLRVTKPRLGVIPAPILFDSGARSLRDGVRYATFTADCHVISISLGWFWNRSLHAALRDAEANNVIVCAAAGNYTPFVVWPAAYPEVIAVAGCNARREPWDGSARGSLIDVSGPAEDVWVASFTADGTEAPRLSKGTSFGVATVAGVAALWLAYHGRDALLERYAGVFTLTDVFRYVLRASSDAFTSPTGGQYGAGIVNARRALTMSLPSIDELRAASLLAPAAPAPATPVAVIASLYPDISEAQLRIWLAQKLGVAQDEVDERIAGFEEEIIFLIVTDPALRSQLADSSRPTGDGPAALDAPSPNAVFAREVLSVRLGSRLE